MWTTPVRSAEVRALYDAAEADRAARPERYVLDVEPILAAAFRKDSLGPDDDGDWREGLAV